MVELAPLPKKSLRRLKDKLLLGRSGCWIWPGAVPTNGYPQLGVPNRPQVPVYRQVYFEYLGEIPDGMHLHHKCYYRRCCNPRHLLPLTPKQHFDVHRMLKKYGPNSYGFWVSSDVDMTFPCQDLLSIYSLGGYVQKDGVVTFKYQPNTPNR
jgi:hypothetical protein